MHLNCYYIVHHHIFVTDVVDTGDLLVGEAADPSRRREAEEEGAHENQFSLEGRPFMAEIFEALNCLENDYLPLFSLCLIFAMQENVGESHLKF